MSQRPGGAAPVAGLLAVVLIISFGLVLSERAADEERPSPAATGPGQVNPDGLGAPTAGLLPPQDLGGRIAPAASDSRALPDTGTGLGPLTVEQVVRAGPVPEGDVPRAVTGLRTLGLLDGFGRAVDAGRYTLTVVVFRFSTPDGAASLVELATDDTAVPSASGVPGAIVLPQAPGSPDVGGLFSYGNYAYELTLSGTVDKTDVDLALRRQYDHVLRTG